MDLGSFIEREGKPALRFDRNSSYPISHVWAALTEPAKLRRWFPSGVTHEAKVGGRIEFFGEPYSKPDTGRILEFLPPTAFAFTWGPDELHMKLERFGNGCRLILINVLATADSAARNAAGWSICLAELDKVLADKPSAGPHSDEAGGAFEAILRMYVAAGMPSGASAAERPS